MRKTGGVTEMTMTRTSFKRTGLLERNPSQSSNGQCSKYLNTVTSDFHVGSGKLERSPSDDLLFTTSERFAQPSVNKYRTNV